MQDALVADGTLVIKIFLHTPAKMQRKRIGRPSRTTTRAGAIDQRDWAMLDLLVDSGNKLESCCAGRR